MRVGIKSYSEVTSSTKVFRISSYVFFYPLASDIERRVLRKSLGDRTELDELFLQDMISIFLDCRDIIIPRGERKRVSTDWWLLVSMTVSC